MEKDQLYGEAYKLWGSQTQLLLLFEEMAELQEAICKHYRGGGNAENIVEEIADVEIMLEQFQYMALIPESIIEGKKKEKLKRLEKRIIEAKTRLEQEGGKGSGND